MAIVGLSLIYADAVHMWGMIAETLGMALRNVLAYHTVVGEERV